MVSKLYSGRGLTWLTIVALFIHTAVSALAVAFLHVPVTTEIDSEEYVVTTDNVISGNGFSLEREPPFRPTALRTPGHLLFDIPIRVFSFGNDICAVVVSKVLLAGTTLLLIGIGKELGLPRAGFAAAIILLFTPSIIYYSLLPYSTEIQYLFYSTLLFYATLTYGTHGNRWGLFGIALASALAILLRPAAMFTLIAYVGAALLLPFSVGSRIRQRLITIAVIVMLGAGTAYCGWCIRNATVFGVFRFSSVGGSHLLKYSARGMMPYLDENGKQELQSVLDANKTFLQRYSGSDQFAIADDQGRAGIRLIVEHPLAFLESHLAGSLSTLVLFEPRGVREHSPWIGIVASTMQGAVTLLGLLGLWRLWQRCSPAQRSMMVLILAFGVVSVLSGGVLFSARFRIPLEPMLALGVANLLPSGLQSPMIHEHSQGLHMHRCAIL